MKIKKKILRKRSSVNYQKHTYNIISAKQHVSFFAVKVKDSKSKVTLKFRLKVYTQIFINIYKLPFCAMCMASFSSKSTIESSYTISSFYKHTYLPSLIHNNLIKRFIGQSLQKTFRAPRKGYSFQPISILCSLKLVISVLILQVIIIYFDWILINIIIQSLNKRAAVTLVRSMANHGGAIIAMDAAERASREPAPV